jgi:AcrR family transcriptional regulator
MVGLQIESESFFSFVQTRSGVNPMATRQPAKRTKASASPPTLRTPRTFKQRRAAATYEALLDAAEKVFARRGFDAAQTPEIAAEAGVSTGALYRYFEDKRQVFLEMAARRFARANDDVTARLEAARFRPGDLRQVVEASVDVLFAHMHRDIALQRVILAVSLADPEVGEMRAAFERQGFERLASLIAAVVPRSVIPEPRAAALVIQLAAVEIAFDRARLRPRLVDDVDDVDVRRALVDMIYRYVSPDSAPR